MQDLDETSITQSVLERVANAPDPRTRQISEALIRHLHAFIREIEPTQAEWEAGIAFLTATGDMAYVVFIERWWGQLASRSEPTEIMIRATLIFRREDGVWKAVHRHGDNAVAKAPPS